VKAAQAVFGTVIMSVFVSVVSKASLWIAGRWDLLSWREGLGIGFAFVMFQAVVRVLMVRPMDAEREPPPFRAKAPFGRGRL